MCTRRYSIPILEYLPDLSAFGVHEKKQLTIGFPGYTGVLHQARLPLDHVLFLSIQVRSLEHDSPDKNWLTESSSQYDRGTYSRRIPLTTGGNKQKYARLRRSLLSLEEPHRWTARGPHGRSKLLRCWRQLSRGQRRAMVGIQGLARCGSISKALCENMRDTSRPMFPCISSIY